MNTSENIYFGSTSINQDISEVGFCKLPPLSDEIINSLSEYYKGLPKVFEKGFHPSMFINDPGLKSEISAKICNDISSYLQEHCFNYRILYGNFMVKEPGNESIMKLHQDWTYVEEPKFESYAIWFPLQDSTTENGALSMIPASHKFMNTVRGPGTSCPFEAFSDKMINEYGYPLYLKKGEPVVWQHRVLHYSPPNFSSTPRIAVTAILVPKDAEIYHFFKQNDSKEVEKYKVYDGFYFNYRIGERPSNYVSLISKSIEDIYSYSWHDIRVVLQHSMYNNQSPWWRNILKIFKRN